MCVGDRERAVRMKGENERNEEMTAGKQEKVSRNNV